MVGCIVIVGRNVVGVMDGAITGETAGAPATGDAVGTAVVGATAGAPPTKGDGVGAQYAGASSERATKQRLENKVKCVQGIVTFSQSNNSL
jgi:hypothetical protein